jgi:hypothetical protein
MGLLSFTEVETSEQDERILNIPETPTTVEPSYDYVGRGNRPDNQWEGP